MMLKVFTQPGCGRSKRLKRWFKDNQVEYEEDALFSLLIDEESLKNFLKEIKDPWILADYQALRGLNDRETAVVEKLHNLHRQWKKWKKSNKLKSPVQDIQEDDVPDGAGALAAVKSSQDAAVVLFESASEPEMKIMTGEENKAGMMQAEKSADPACSCTRNTSMPSTKDAPERDSDPDRNRDLDCIGISSTGGILELKLNDSTSNSKDCLGMNSAADLGDILNGPDVQKKENDEAGDEGDFYSADSEHQSKDLAEPCELCTDSSAELQLWPSSILNEEEMECLIHILQNNPSCIYRPVIHIKASDLDPAVQNDLRDYLGFRDNSSCGSCNMIPVCSQVRERDHTLLIMEEDV